MRPHVLHVIDHTGSGGAQVVIGYLLRTLKDRFTFSVAVLGKAGQFSAIYRELGIPVFELAGWGGRWNPLTGVRLAHIIDRQKVDLIHSHLYKSCIVGALAGKWKGCRVILHDHGGIYPQSLKHLFSNRVIRRLYAYCYRGALSWCDRALVLTTRDLDAYREYYTVPPYKVVCLPNAVDLNRFEASHPDHAGGSLRQELGLSAETRIGLMIGRLDPQKDWGTFLEVARQVQRQADQPCAFLAVGSGSEEPRLRDYLGTHKIGQVFLLGDREDVPSLLAQADFFLLTSRRESFGIVVLEAMAAGCPVVATRSGGPEAILTHGVDGLLADVGDVHGLVNQVLNLLRDDGLRSRLVRRGRQTVSERYRVETIAARMADVYEEVLHS